MSDTHQIDTFLSQIHLPKVNDEQNNKFTSKITEGEFRSAFGRLKGGKSLGTDSFTSECYKAMQDQLIPTLLRACYCVLEKKIILPSWKDSIMSIIQKKGRDTLNCSNYHPVSVLNVDYKLFTAILSRRRKDQTDFIRQRETQDNIRKTQHIMKHVAQYKTKTLV